MPLLRPIFMAWPFRAPLMPRVYCRDNDRRSLGVNGGGPVRVSRGGLLTRRDSQLRAGPIVSCRGKRPLLPALILHSLTAQTTSLGRPTLDSLLWRRAFL